MSISERQGGLIGLETKRGKTGIFCTCAEEGEQIYWAKDAKYGGGKQKENREDS